MVKKTPIDEWVDLVDPSGRPTGETVLKSDAHRKGLLHPTVHIWCYSGDGRILLQQRGVRKSTFPLKWDVSVAGHIGAGEGPIKAALREIEEEIGLDMQVEHLQKIGLHQSLNHHDNGIIDAEIHHVFLLKLDPEKVTLSAQPEEVEALEWWPLRDYQKELERSGSDARFVPLDPQYRVMVLEAIKSYC